MDIGLRFAHSGQSELSSTYIHMTSNRFQTTFLGLVDTLAPNSPGRGHNSGSIRRQGTQIDKFIHSIIHLLHSTMRIQQLLQFRKQGGRYLVTNNVLAPGTNPPASCPTTTRSAKGRRGHTGLRIAVTFLTRNLL